MGEKSGSLVQGTLDMLILKTLALEAMHGYGIAQRIEQISQGVFCVNPGSQARVEAYGEQSPRQILRPDRARPQAIALRNRRVGPPDRRHRPHSGSQLARRYGDLEQIFRGPACASP